jgi:proteasome assembly chaperone (PAC2) family protein
MGKIVAQSMRKSTNANILLFIYMVSFPSIPFSDDIQIKLSWCNWLYAIRNDGKPRTLRLLVDSIQNEKYLIEQIKKV